MYMASPLLLPLPSLLFVAMLNITSLLLWPLPGMLVKDPSPPSHASNAPDNGTPRVLVHDSLSIPWKIYTGITIIKTERKGLSHISNAPDMYHIKSWNAHTCPQQLGQYSRLVRTSVENIFHRHYRKTSQVLRPKIYLAAKLSESIAHSEFVYRCSACLTVVEGVDYYVDGWRVQFHWLHWPLPLSCTTPNASITPDVRNTLMLTLLIEGQRNVR